ncbi:patatin-like phospholipase family protein [Mesorhizobium sp. BAC0120]|uniref:patatin-like phospholipase family protein n=1 Tax=Mesorhizobium sp. BAC0120 TaxID=3090670 RepID=UPI00298D0EE5|nr:patatin-like phospholipase family protein [Mesorhizobium sp. BAC0120]MDW6026280.1 patatin-like phospholipase family protein [Mesorhizobium sp. BAC0120]
MSNRRWRASLAVLARALLLVLATVQLSGCLSGAPRNAVPENFAPIAQVKGYPPDIRIWGDTLITLPPERVMQLREQRLKAAKSDPAIKPGEINALTLSGGGSSGAFGAGVLAGWTEAGTRPQFDLVTGISTGALIAPFAFLGPDYDKPLGEAFTTVGDDDIFKWAGLRGVIRTGAFTSNEPLRKMLEKYITDDVIDKVAVEYAKGRRLLIGTTNLDADRPVIWNMGAIAASKRPDRNKLFRDVILASTSIPGVFPPIHFNVDADGKSYDEMHVDGGVTTEVFLMPAGMTLKAIDRKLGIETKPRLFVIRNGRTNPEFSVTKATLPAIAGKAIGSLIDTQAVGDLYRLYAISQRDGIDYNVIDIPDSFNVKSESPFDNKFMRALYDTGYQMGRNGVPWKKFPPGFRN